jgi:hypothetical protein
MKIILTITILLTIQLLANYAFSDEKTVNIDMHGGKSEMMNNTSGFSKMGTNDFKGLKSFSVKEPIQPNKPEEKTVPSLEDIELKQD